MMSELLTAIVMATVGGSGVVGIIFFLIRRWLERKLFVIEQQKEITRRNRLRRAQLEDELHHAQGRVLFWVNRYIETGERNGELKSSFAALTAVEEKMKEHDREIIANNS
jgi:alpha-beta hydrolase superfamily lysophospholipase